MGCYRYIPVTGVTTPVLGDSRVVLTERGSVALAESLGPNIREIDGVIVRATADSVVMTVAQTTTASRERFISTGVTVAIARPLVQEVSTRTLSRKRSLTFGAAVLAILSVALGAVTAASASGTGDGAGSIQP